MTNSLDRQAPWLTSEPLDRLRRRAPLTIVRRRRRASPEWAGREAISVAALPGRGLYVRHLSHPEGVDGVHRPTVPAPGAPRRPDQFTPAWVATYADRVDVVHVHAVPSRLTPREVGEAVAGVRAARRPLVVTAYHLSDPTGGDEAHHAAQLDALLPAADAVITLTERAAAEIYRRWEVTATLVPHPHAVDFVRMRQPRPPYRPGSFTIGAHLGRLQLAADPVRVVTALARAAGRVPGSRLAVYLHENLLDPEAASYAPAPVRQIERALAQHGGVLRAHRPLTDPQLWDNLFCLDAAFVPPLAGTHSVWPEGCHDLGTTALLPAGTAAATQRPALTYPTDADGVPDVDGLEAALHQGAEQGPCWRATPTERWAERVRICETLRRLYEQLLGAR
jgi:hypothetical protein